jgi:hypothetical protein
MIIGRMAKGDTMGTLVSKIDDLYRYYLGGFAWHGIDPPGPAGDRATLEALTAHAIGLLDRSATPPKLRVAEEIPGEVERLAPAIEHTGHATPDPEEPAILFDFEGRTYEAPMAFYHRNAVRLPDGRGLLAGGWYETMPPSPADLTVDLRPYSSPDIPRARLTSG